MSETARAMLELVEAKGWAALTREEQALFDEWMQHGHGVDLYLLMRHALRKWTRRRSSSSTTFEAAQETAREPSIPPPGDGDDD